MVCSEVLLTVIVAVIHVVARETPPAAEWPSGPAEKWPSVSSQRPIYNTESISDEDMDFYNENSIEERKICKPKTSCTRAGGKCIKGGAKCDGTVDMKGCKGKCKCCVPGQVCGNCGSPAWFPIEGIANQCFHVSIKDLTWSSAKDYCVSQGGTLAQPKDHLETLAVYFKQYQRDQFYYLGGSDHAHEGDWRWLDGHKIASRGWRSGEPNESGGGEDCLVINPWNHPTQGTLWDFQCHAALPFICQRMPRKAVCDGGCGHGTCTSPGNCDCHSGYTGAKCDNDPCLSVGGERVSGQCLIFSSESKSWPLARRICEERGQRLAVLTDPAAFEAYARTNYVGGIFYLGASDSKNEGTWTWINGVSIGSSFPWGPNEPNDNGGNEDCLEWGRGANGVYNDGVCTTIIRYICEAQL